MLNKEKISATIFEALIIDLFSFYKKVLGEMEVTEEIDAIHIEICQTIRNFPDEEVLNPRRGFVKHIFARDGDDEHYYSIGAIIKNKLGIKNQDPDADLSDFLYKKCNSLDKGMAVIEVYQSFFELLGYNSIREYCAKKKLDYNFKKIQNRKVSRIITESAVRLENRLKGRWWLYFFNNEGFGHPSFATAELNFKNLNSIDLINNTTTTSLNYLGKIDDSVTKIAGVVYLKFTPVKKWVNRNLRIALHISEDMDIELAVGQYTNIDSGGHLIRGSVCMESIKEGESINSEEEENKGNLKHSLETIAKEFRWFLADKNLNFNRLPNSQFNLVSFREWLGEQKAKRHYKHTQSINENKKLFISCPIHSVSAQQFQELKDIVNKIETHFKKEFGFTDVHSFIKKLKEQKDKSATPDRIEYQSVVEMFNKCSYYLALWPLKLQLSGIIFEIGWAVMKDRPVAIFEQVHDANDTLAKSQIPHLLRGGCGAKGSGIERYTFEKYDEILKILDNNELNDIFINPRPRD